MLDSSWFMTGLGQRSATLRSAGAQTDVLQVACVWCRAKVSESKFRSNSSPKPESILFRVTRGLLPPKLASLVMDWRFCKRQWCWAMSSRNACAICTCEEHSKAMPPSEAHCEAFKHAKALRLVHSFTCRRTETRKISQIAQQFPGTSRAVPESCRSILDASQVPP